MSYKSFEFSLKTDYVFTENAAEALKGQLERYKPAKPFVITSDARFKVVGQVKEMLEEMGLPYVLRTDCMSNPTSDFVNECAAQATAEGCDFQDHRSAHRQPHRGRHLGLCAFRQGAYQPRSAHRSGGHHPLHRQ